jgi:putative transposase
VRRDLAAWLGKWSGKYPKLTGWVEENIEETLTYFHLPLALNLTHITSKTEVSARRLDVCFSLQERTS